MAKTKTKPRASLKAARDKLKVLKLKKSEPSLLFDEHLGAVIVRCTDCTLLIQPRSRPGRDDDDPLMDMQCFYHGTADVTDATRVSELVTKIRHPNTEGRDLLAAALFEKAGRSSLPLSPLTAAGTSCYASRVLALPPRRTTPSVKRLAPHHAHQ